MFFRNTDAVVDHTQCPAAIPPPDNGDMVAITRVVYCIRKEICKRTCQLIVIALEIDFFDMEADTVPACG